MNSDEKLAGKVALVTGAAQGMGRAHAVRLARAGADVVMLDICEQIPSVEYPLGTSAKLEETADLVREQGRTALAFEADVREPGAVDDVVAAARRELGHVDIAVANAGINNYGPTWELSEEQWGDVVGVNLTGVFRTLKAVGTALIEQGTGGAMVATSSGAVFRGYANTSHYTAAKYGVIALCRTFAQELAEHDVRVNAVCPTQVDTAMITGDPSLPGRFRPDLENPTFDDMVGPLTEMNAMPVRWVDPEDVANAVAWLVSDEARYVTGIAMPVDAGLAIK